MHLRTLALAVVALAACDTGGSDPRHPRTSPSEYDFFPIEVGVVGSFSVYRESITSDWTRNYHTSWTKLDTLTIEVTDVTRQGDERRVEAVGRFRSGAWDDLDFVFVESAGGIVSLQPWETDRLPRYHDVEGDVVTLSLGVEDVFGAVSPAPEASVVLERGRGLVEILYWFRTRYRGEKVHVLRIEE